MKNSIILSSLALSLAFGTPARAAVVFEKDFNEDIAGWTAVAPSYASSYIDGPLRWIYDIAHEGFSENSNIYTDNPSFAPSAAAPMLINDAVAGDEYTFRVRLNFGDNDAAGLVFGYQDEANFYRLTFAIQDRTDEGFPYDGWSFDRMTDGQAEVLGGNPVAFPSFIPAQGQPFDVIVEVKPGNVLDVAIDTGAPAGQSSAFDIISDLSLPSSAAGQVGLMVWGQSGGTPPGVLHSDMSLEPGGLVNGAPETLPGWEIYVPGNAVGDAAAYEGNWGLAFGENGVLGSLNESSNAFLSGTDIEGNSHIDFSAPTIVGGDAGWTDYIYTARITPGDDDGHGVVFRFQDPDNFYRVSLSSQTDGDGRPWQGVSGQKKVNGEWSEIFRDESLSYVPVNNVPYELIATVNGDSLDVAIIHDPDGAAEQHFFGPFDIEGPTVDGGRIGLFSWGMNFTSVDFVSVAELSGVPLQVESAFGNPTPPVGVSSYNLNDEVTASVESSVQETDSIRRVLQGWTGSGSVPESGTENSVTFNIDRFSLLTWVWGSEYRLAAEVESGQGQVTGAEQEWFVDGEIATIEAVADSGFVFAGWRGSSFSTSNPLRVMMDQPKTLQAVFVADSDGDGLPDAWETDHFGDLSQSGDGDADEDGVSNGDELARGTDPGFEETLIVEDGFPAVWENVKRDPTQSGLWQVLDFGDGYRGVGENSNDHRGADLTGGPAPLFPEDLIVPSVSFEGPRLIVSESVWDPAWTDYTVEATVVIGDNDGNNVYVRYQDEDNWIRVHVQGEDAPASWRPHPSLSVQRKLDGVYSELAVDDLFFLDPADVTGFKQFRVTVTADGPNCEVRVIGWDTFFFDPPIYDPANEVVVNFVDDALLGGRAGIGSWGQSGSNATELIPVGVGVLFNDFTVTVDGNVVFQEDWSDALLSDELPAGWENPFAEDASGLAGDWRSTPHGIVQMSNFFTSSTGTLESPKADVEGPILLGPDPMSQNYFLELGFHPFDNDGMGFVYDYVDPDNFARVLFRSEVPATDGSVPQGVAVGRKSGGVWTDILIGDNSFVYEQGRPFAVEFAMNNGQQHLRVWEIDNPGNVASLAWTDQTPAPGNRFGLHTWGQTEAHFMYARAYELPAIETTGDLRISRIETSNGQVTLTIENNGAAYDVQQATGLSPANWTTIESGLTGGQWTGDVPAGVNSVFWRLAGQ